MLLERSVRALPSLAACYTTHSCRPRRLRVYARDRETYHLRYKIKVPNTALYSIVTYDLNRTEYTKRTIKFTIHAARAARAPLSRVLRERTRPHFSHQNPSNSAWSSSWHGLVSVTSCSASNHSNTDGTKTSGLTEPRSPKASSHAKCAPRKKACSLMSLAPSRRLPYRREMSFCSSLPGWGYGLRATGWG